MKFGKSSLALLVAAATLFAIASTGPAQAQRMPWQRAETTAISPPSYADVATVAVQAATIIDADIRRVRRLEPARAIGVAAGSTRFYVEGNVRALIYGRTAIAPRIAWLVDLPNQADGRPARLARGRVLLFARPVANPAQLQLVSPSAQIMWSAEAEVHARSVAMELAQGDVPPAIAGVSQAFHSPGVIAGTGETQIFLRTESGFPVALTIQRDRSGRRWSAAFGEVVSAEAAPPAPGSIAHFRLSCGLPRSMPASALVDTDAANRTRAAEDYAFVVAQVGNCGRSAPAPVAG